jgi:hypothetical protein
MQEQKKGDEFTRRQFMWLDQVLADQSLPMGVFQVAYVIAKHIHRVHGDAFLGTRRLSEKAGVSRVFAIKAMRLLETTGHLAVENGNGRGNTNRYQMVEKGAPGEQETVHGVDRFDEIKGTRQEGKGTRQEGKGTRQEGKGTQGGPDSFTNPLTNPFTNPFTPAAPASPASLSDSDSNPSEASFFEQQGRAAKEGKKASKEESAPQKLRRPPRGNATVAPPPDAAAGCGVPKRRRFKDKPPADDPTFEQFWEAYPKKVAKGGARKAYQAAIEKASAEDIIAGARRYVGSDTVLRGFVCNPSTWLNGERWLDQPADTRVIDQFGQPDTPHRANGHGRSKVDEAIARNLENCRRMGILS